MSKTLVIGTNWKTLTVEAPSFIAVNMTQELIDRLKHLHELAKKEDLTEVRSKVDLDCEPIEGETLSHPEMVVTKGQFSFSAELNYAEGEFVRSHSISLFDWDYVYGWLTEPETDDVVVVERGESNLKTAYLEMLAARKAA